MAEFQCWEFHGQGDMMFGGKADDRLLAKMPDGSLKFLSSFDRFMQRLIGPHSIRRKTPKRLASNTPNAMA